MPASWKSLNAREKIVRGHTLFWWALVFPVVVIALAYTAISTALRSQAILDDHTIIQAVVSADEETPPTRQLARFKYSFEIDGKTYSENFPVPWTRAEKMEIGSTIPVAYANFDPNLSQREERLADNADMKSSLLSVAIMSALAALLIGLLWLFFNWLIRLQMRLLQG